MTHNTWLGLLRGTSHNIPCPRDLHNTWNVMILITTLYGPCFQSHSCTNKQYSHMRRYQHDRVTLRETGQHTLLILADRHTLTFVSSMNHLLTPTSGHTAQWNSRDDHASRFAVPLCASASHDVSLVGTAALREGMRCASRHLGKDGAFTPAAEATLSLSFHWRSTLQVAGSPRSHPARACLSQSRHRRNSAHVAHSVVG